MRIRGIATSGVRRLLDLALVTLIAVSLIAVILARFVPMTGRSTFVVASGSMAPVLPTGAVVIVEPVDPALLRVGDIVSLRSGAQRAIFTHRITRLVERDGAPWIETKGDANGTLDPSITPGSAVIGRVVVTVPAVGFLVAWLSLPSGALSVIAMGFALMTASWLLAGGGRTARAPGRAGLIGTPLPGAGR